MQRLLPFLLAFAGIAGLVAQQPAAKPDAEPKATVQKTDGYPFDTCVVSGEPIDDSAKVFTVEGHTFKTCCRKCQSKVEKDPKTYVEKLESAVVAAQTPTYALTTCPISGKKIDDKAVAVVAANTLVKLCCGNCKTKLAADPAAAVAKVQAAAMEKQAASYTAKTCPVSGHDLDQNAVPVMHGTTLVKLCCSDCMAKLQETPNAMAAKVAPKAGKSEGKETQGKQAEKSDGKAPSDMTPSGEAGGAACCETGKAESGCCQSGAGATGNAGGCCAGKAQGQAAPQTTPAKKSN